MFKEKAFLEALSALPYFLFGLTAFLGSKINQPRVVLVMSLFLTAYLWGGALIPLRDVTNAQRNQILAIALPASLWMLFTLPNARVLSQKGALLILAAFLPVLLLATMTLLGWGFIQRIIAWQWLFYSPVWRLSDSSLLLMAGFASRIPLQKDRHFRDFALGVFFALIPIFFFLNESAARVTVKFMKMGSSLAYASAGFIVLYSIYRMYWERVYIDELTGIPNRRALDERLQGIPPESTLAMVDIDHFKSFNDTYGHDEGDNVLRFVAQFFHKSFPASFYRYGGEEFCLVFEEKGIQEIITRVDQVRQSLSERDFTIRSPQTSLRIIPAQKKAHRVRRAIKPVLKDASLRPTPGHKVHVTVSIGLATQSQDLVSPAEVMKAADQALYQAKKSGRNRLIVAG